MKSINTIRIKGASLLAFLFLLVTASSCQKQDDTTAASAFISVINTAEGSSAQDFYVDNAKVTTSAVAYGSSSGYLTTASGNHTGLFMSGSTSANASLSLSLQSGNYYSVFYTGNASSSSAVTTQDDMSAPPSGKARVRFIHLSSAAASTVDFGVSATAKLVTGLAYKAASAYYTVDANTAFFLYASGSTTAALSIPTTIQAGKIYTIYVSGSTIATISYHIVAQN